MSEQDGMNLTETEALALAHLVVARHIHHTEDWLEWEDYPNLGQYAFERLNQAVRDLALHHYWQRLNGVDAAEFLERAT